MTDLQLDPERGISVALNCDLKQGASSEFVNGFEIGFGGNIVDLFLPHWTSRNYEELID